jgi:polysaccharide biosynthesis protein PslG
LSTFRHLGRTVAAVVAFSAFASLGILNAGTSGAQPLNRQQSGKLAVASQAALQARTAERSHLQQVARLACASHKRALCAKSRARLARLSSDSTRVDRTATARRGSIHKATRPGHKATRPAPTATPAVPNATPPAPSSSSGTTSPSSSFGSSSSGSSGSSESGPITGTLGSSGSSGSGAESGSSETFGQPFVKGITANFEGEGPNNVPEEVSEMHSLGVNWTREALDWSEAEPQKGVFAWSSFDRVVAEAKANGISILPIVGYAPSWTSPTNAAAYAEFVAAAVARYGPGTSANLQWWELWNEPYFAYAWSEHTPEPEAYGRDALAAAEAAKRVSPTVKLLIAADYQEAGQTGGSSPTEQTWIDDMFTAAPTLGKWIDGVSVHPYGGDPSTPLAEAGGYLDTNGVWGFQRIDTIREKFLAHGVNVPFWITEEGWSTWDDSEATVAHNYADLITQIKARPWIRALFPFGLREDDPHPTNDQPGFGLLKYGIREPKAAWAVLQEGFKTLS